MTVFEVWYATPGKPACCAEHPQMDESGCYEIEADSWQEAKELVEARHPKRRVYAVFERRWYEPTFNPCEYEYQPLPQPEKP